MGGMLATKHLIDLGHKKIAFIGGDIEHPSIKERFNGYKNSLEKSGIPVTAGLIEISENYPGQTNGYKAAEKLFSKKNNITAIFACNDAMAVGAIKYLKDKNRKIPEEISVIGFDDVIPENGFEPALSTVRVHKTELGSEAVRLISNIIKSGSNGTLKKFVPVELVIRRSTKSL